MVRAWECSAKERIQFDHHVQGKATSDAARTQKGQEAFVGCIVEYEISEGLYAGESVLIAPACGIIDKFHVHGDASLSVADQNCRSAPVVLEDNFGLGTDVVVPPEATIEIEIAIYAIAAVIRSTEAVSIVADVPALSIGKRNATQ